MGHSPRRAGRHSQDLLDFGPVVCGPSPELSSLAASFGARR